MSKRSLFWGNGSGKLGEAVFYRAGGEQRTRTYVAKIKNPKSNLQAIQRTRFNNAVAVYRGLDKVIKSIFKIEKSNQSPFNAFMRQNFAVNQYVADKEMTGIGEGIASDFLVSNGSLGINTTMQEITFKPVEDAEGSDIYALGVSLQPSDITFQRELPNGVSLYQGSEFYQLLAGESNPYNLPSEFTVIIIKAAKGFVGGAYFTFIVKCSASSTDVLKCVQFPARTEPPTKEEIEGIVRPVNGTFTAKEPPAKSTLEGVSSIAFGGSVTSQEANNEGFALIVAYRDSGGLQTTRSRILFAKGLKAYANNYAPDGEVGRDIVNSYTIVSNKLAD